MSTAQIKSAFNNAVGADGICGVCTMQYVDEGKVQLLRFYVRRTGGEHTEEVIEVRVPRGESLIAAAQREAAKFKEKVA